MDIVERVKKICLSPDAEWPVIAGESSPVAGLITGYVLPLAAIGAVAGLIGNSLIGTSLGSLGTYRASIGTGLGLAITNVVMAVVMVVLLGLIIDALAPTFGVAKNSGQAFKVAAYSPTPAWVAGILQIIPALGILALLAGLYGIYLLYLGLQRVMKCSAEKAIGYTVVTVVCVIVIGFIMSAISASMWAPSLIG